MEEEVKITQDHRCRLCLENSNNRQNLFSPDFTFKEAIEDLTGIKIEFDENLPSSICISCIEIIKTLLEFRDTCIESQDILSREKNLLKIEINNTEKSENDNDNYPLNIKIENDTLAETNTVHEDDIEKLQEDVEVPKNISIKRTKRVKKIIDNSSNDGRHSKQTKKTNQIKSKSKRLNNRKQVAKSEEIPDHTKSKSTIISKNEPKMKLWKKYAQSYDTPCYICGKLYSKFVLQYHINSHLDRRPFVCKVENCDKAFSSPTHLRQHNLHCHSDDTPHKCEICGRGCKTSAALRVHKTYHFDPQLPCELCGKLLRNRKALKKHLFNHTGERPYKCDECDKSFKSQWSLKVHLRIHTKEKPFLCTVCGEYFTYSQMLKQHVEKNHPGSVVSYAQHRPETEENLQ